MKLEDFAMLIRREANGYILKYPAETGEVFIREVIQDDEGDDLKSGEGLLWSVIEYFGLSGSKYDKERLWITRERGERYAGGKDE